MTELNSRTILIIANQVKYCLYLEFLPLPCRWLNFPEKKWLWANGDCDNWAEISIDRRSNRCLLQTIAVASTNCLLLSTACAADKMLLETQVLIQLRLNKKDKLQWVFKISVDFSWTNFDNFRRKVFIETSQTRRLVIWLPGKAEGFFKPRPHRRVPWL